MAVFRIEKARDYTVMSNYHLRDRSLSLKAKGLLSLMLSLPEDWDYTMKGLARICKDGIDSISGGIRELEAHGYLVRARVRNENGQLGSIEYTILEQPKEPAQTPAPIREKPIRENPIQVKPMLDAPIQENPAQLNTKEQNKELSITQGSSPIPSSSPKLTVGGDVLHFQRQLLDPRPGLPQLRFQPGGIAAPAMYLLPPLSFSKLQHRIAESFPPCQCHL